MKYLIQRTVVVLLSSLGGFFLFVCLWFYFNQSSLVYLPSAKMVAVPEQVGLQKEDVFFPSADQTRLHGWFFQGSGSRVLLFCHGNGGNISYLIDSVRPFLDLGLSVFLFDYRGYGQSEGKASEAGTLADSLAAYDQLIKRGYKAESIIVLGRSLGGAHAAWVAKNCAIRGLILESAFESLMRIGQEIYPFLPLKLLGRMQFATSLWIQDLKIPLLILHSQDDEMIRFAHAKSIYDNYTGPKTLIPLRGDHNEGYFLSGSLYTEGLKRWFEQFP